MRSRWGAFFSFGEYMEQQLGSAPAQRDILPQIAEPEERAIHLHGVGRAFERLADEGRDNAGADAVGAYKEAAQPLYRDKDPGFYGVIMHDIGDIQFAAGNLTEAVAAYREACWPAFPR